MKLYELTSDLIELENLDLDDESIADTLEAVSGEFNDKAVAILKFTENMNSDIESLSHEIKRLQERKKLFENRKARIREYLLYNLEKSGINKIECPFFTASIRKGSESVDIENIELLTDEYVTVEVLEKPDKNAIKRDLKAGKEISGAKLVRGANTIIIK
mgnify:CR=1 FL=1